MSAQAPPRAPRAAIPWYQRLEARVLVAVTLIAGCSLAAVTIVTGRVVESHSLDRAREDLAATRAAFTHLITTRTEFAHAQTKLIATLPVFRAYMTDMRLASDRETMEVMADAYRRDLSAAFCIVTAADGRWLASPGARMTGVARSAIEDLIRGVLNRGPARRLLALDGTVFLVVSEPVTFADEVLGTLTSAYRLDDEVARDLAQTTRSHVVFVAGNTISGSSVGPSVRQSLDAFVRADTEMRADRRDVSLMRIGDSQFVSGFFPLEPGAPHGTSGSLILLEDWRPTQQFIDDIARQLLRAGAIVFLLALIGSSVLSRRMSRPLREIAEIAGEIADGQWDRHVPVRGSAEAMAMAQAFNGMTTGLSHWHAEASRRTEQLQAAYERYAAVTNSAHDAIVSANTNGAIMFWNQSAHTTFGYTEAEAIGLSLPALFDLSSREAAERILSDVATSESGRAARVFEGRGLRQSGDTFPLELTIAAWKAGGLTYVTAIIRDTTERRRAQDTLQQRDAQLRQAQKLEAIGRLASGVAHDFNNALAVIHGYTEQLMICLGDSHEYYDDLHEVLKASQSAAALTRQLLAFSRKQPLDPQVLSLTTVVADVRKMLQRLLGEGVELTTSFDAADEHVFADRGQLEQVIVNLCVNARDAMPDGGRLEIGIRRSTLSDESTCSRLGVAHGEFVTLTVRDTGHGMTPDVAAHIFEPFFTTKESGKGTGLGLAMVYGIVTQSGGAIELDTAPGCGTTFSIHLPEARQAADAAASSPVAPVVRGGGTILVVEDEDPVRTIVRKSLDAAGYEVLEACSGAEALERLRRHDGVVDVLLTDIVMPGMSGLALSDAVAAERPGTRVLFMSGHAADAIARHGFDPAHARLLQKPFSIQTLCHELHNVLTAPAEG